MPSDRSSRPCACAAAEGVPGGPRGRIGLGRRPRWFSRGFQSIGCRCDAWGHASVQRRRPRSSACASAYRPATALRCSKLTWNDARALRVELPPPVRSIAPATSSTSRARWLTGWTVDRTPLLRFLSPSALPVHVALCREAPPLRQSRCDVGGRRPSSFALGTPRATRSFVSVRPRHRAPTHRRRLLVPAVLRSAGASPVDSARIDAARFGRDALPPSTRRCIAPRRSPRHGSCAVRYLWGGVPLPTDAGHVAWSGPLSASKLAWVSVP